MADLQNIIAGLRFDIHSLEQRLFKVQMITSIIMVIQEIGIVYLVINCA
jgi:hypothetical protein